MCATMIGNALRKAWSGPLPADAAPRAYPARPLIDGKSYSRGRLLSHDAVRTDEHWRKGVPDWPRENRGAVRPRFAGTPMIYSSTAHARLSVPFTGTAIGAYGQPPGSGTHSCHKTES